MPFALMPSFQSHVDSPIAALPSHSSFLPHARSTRLRTGRPCAPPPPPCRPAHWRRSREQFHYYRFGSNPNGSSTETDAYELNTTLAYGLTRGLALFVDVPVEFENHSAPSGSPDDGWDKGVGDIDAMLKYRFYRKRLPEALTPSAPPSWPALLRLR